MPAASAIVSAGGTSQRTGLTNAPASDRDAGDDHQRRDQPVRAGRRAEAGDEEEDEAADEDADAERRTTGDVAGVAAGSFS